MQQLRTNAVVLRRVNYGEADRILTLLTEQYGKIVVIAKGVRKEKSKLAGGIELFCVSDIMYLPGKNTIGTLVSTKLIGHYDNIHTDLERMKIASDFLKRIDIVTEHELSAGYFDLAVQLFAYLNNHALPAALVESWGTMRLLHLLGETPNMENDAEGYPFDDSAHYSFRFEDNKFIRDPKGEVVPHVIKLMRLYIYETPPRLASVKNVEDYALMARRVMNYSYAYHRPS